MSDINKPPYRQTPDLNPPRNEPGAKHRRWVVHSHEAFRPELVDKHLDTVRQKLAKRRMGLLQNPVHTTDPSARRTDEVALPRGHGR